MSDFPHSALDEYKTQASLLLKQLRSDNAQKALESALRFQQLPHLADKSTIEIVKSEQIKLKLLPVPVGDEKSPICTELSCRTE